MRRHRRCGRPCPTTSPPRRVARGNERTCAAHEASAERLRAAAPSRAASRRELAAARPPSPRPRAEGVAEGPRAHPMECHAGIDGRRGGGAACAAPRHILAERARVVQLLVGSAHGMLEMSAVHESQHAAASADVARVARAPAAAQQCPPPRGEAARGPPGRRVEEARLALTDTLDELVQAHGVRPGRAGPRHRSGREGGREGGRRGCGGARGVRVVRGQRGDVSIIYTCA